ncbi:hypothetical protein ACQP2P_12020 [Dactylosporangium sp. CA-139114]|uniref:hypothetical protein n=1 Tax=Dactylosporangium sp. CA-139114 TaxID=3239931 RepID=UPI003D95FEB4
MAAGIDDLVYLTGEVGVGGGVIVNGHPPEDPTAVTLPPHNSSRVATRAPLLLAGP